jgi:hypothetical protein
MMWIIVGSISAFFIALLVFHSYRSPTEQMSHPVHPKPTDLLRSAEIPSMSVDEPLNKAYENLTADATTTNSYVELQEPNPKVEEEQDPRLRIFEEL